MKTMKKILVLAMVLAMMLCMVVTASAATYNVTINNDKTGHTYEAYQIFIGDLSGAANPDDEADTEAKLSNIKWGTGVAKYNGTNVTAGTDASAAVDELKSGTLSEFLAKLTLSDVKATSGAQSEDKYVISRLAAGYYLIKDATGSQNGAYDAYTSYIIEVVENSVVNPKVSIPSVEKGVGDSIDINAADAEIGETVTFILEGRLGDNLATYKTYKIVFHDTISAGLDLVENSVKVMLGEDDITEEFDIKAEDDAAGSTKLTVSCEDVKAADVGAKDNDVITVTYNAKLNKDAKVGSEGNSNKVYLEYSNDPNWVEDGEPGTPPPTGETPEDEVLVFTYKLNVLKVDGQSQDKDALEGAEFVLLNKDKDKYAVVEDGVLKEWKAVPADNVWPADSKLVSNEDGLFSIKGLSSEVYYLKEIKAPAGYNLLENPVEVEIVTSLNTADNQAEEETLAIKIDAGESTDGDVAKGEVEATVENNPGTVLPETGGVGTTLFYIIGGLLVAAAVVLLVTKKRMASAE